MKHFNSKQRYIPYSTLFQLLGEMRELGAASDRDFGPLFNRLYLENKNLMIATNEAQVRSTTDWLINSPQQMLIPFLAFPSPIISYLLLFRPLFINLLKAEICSRLLYINPRLPNIK